MGKDLKNKIFIQKGAVFIKKKEKIAILLPYFSFLLSSYL